MLKESLREPSVVRKDLFIAFFLLFNVFSWRYVMLLIIDSILSDLHVTYTQDTTIWVAYYSAIIGSGLVGSILSSKISRLNLLYFWVILGAVLSSLPALVNSFTVTHAMLISILLGTSFGLGMPSCLAYFADCTHLENRGQISGITWLVTNLSAPLFAFSFGMLDLKASSLIFAAWRAFGLFVFFLKPEKRIDSEIKTKNSFISILRNKSFALYFTAWLMFNLIDSFERPILDYIFGDFQYILAAPVIGSVFTLIAGVSCDRIGRKRVALYGFVAMGIAYAIVGIAPATLFSWYFFITTESISWAIFFVVFILILWGDLSESGNREKYYVIGAATPYFLSDIVRMLSAPFVTFIPASSAFSLASFFLFLAVLPLLYAPETLPERKIELRRLRRYVEKAKKLQQEYAEKTIVEYKLSSDVNLINKNIQLCDHKSWSRRAHNS